MNKGSVSFNALIIFLEILLLPFVVSQQIGEGEAPFYEFTIERDWLTMKDGMRLSVTYLFQARSQVPGGEVSRAL